VRQDGAGQLDRAEDVRLDLVLDLLVGELLGGAEQAVAGVRDDGVDAVEIGERLVDDRADRAGVGDVEPPDPEPISVPGRQRVKRLGPAQRRGRLVPAAGW
jgi:hypothetical protein